MVGCNSYFRNFKVYSYIFGVQARVFLQQKVRGFIDCPASVLPLSLGVEVHHPPALAASQDHSLSNVDAH
jgi:hypothetical protein